MLDPEGVKTSFSLTTLQPSLFQKNISCKCGFPFGTDFIISIFSCMLSLLVHFWKRGAPLYQELNVQKIFIIKLEKFMDLGQFGFDQLIFSKKLINSSYIMHRLKSCIILWFHIFSKYITIFFCLLDSTIPYIHNHSRIFSISLRSEPKCV